MRARLTIVLLVLFVACDIALVTLSLRHTSASTPQSDSVGKGSVRSSSDPAGPSGAPSDGKTIAPSSSPQPALGGPIYISLGARGRALWAARGDCDTGHVPQVSVAARGESEFLSRPVEGLAEVLRLHAQRDGTAWLIGRTDECAIARWTSVNAGRSWTATDGSGADWYLAPSPTQQAVFAPDGRRRTPCVPINVSPIDMTVARLLCDDGRLLGTSDGGDSWVQLGSLDGAVSIDFATPGDGVALAGLEQCPAAVMTTSDGGTSWSRLACLNGGEPSAISREGEDLVALLGDKALRSTDGGSTWSVR